MKKIFILLAVILIFAPSYFKTFESFELATLDLRFNLRPIQAQNNDIAVIEIANDTLEKIGRWPFRRNWHAAMIDILSAYGAKAIVFDALFSEKSPDDDVLIESTRKAGNVYYAYSFDLSEGKKEKILEAEGIDTSLLPGLRESARGYGFINIIPDRDGKRRRVPLKIRYKKSLYPHLALLVASDYLEKDFSEINVPLDEESLALINFAGRWAETFKHYSYIDIIKSYSLLAKGEQGAVDLNELKDKVCFIGLTATATHDLNPMPLEKAYPSVGIHLNVFNSIVTKNFLRRADRLTNLIILFILSFITLLVAFKARPLISSLFIISLEGLLCMAAVAVFILANLWIDLFYPVIAIFIIYLSLTFYRYVSERQRRQLIEKELEVASKIQQSFLPKNPPESDKLLIAAHMSPAKQVGGDLYDFVEFKDGKLGVMIGDVSGKGVPAALYMAKAISLFRIFSKEMQDAKGTVSKLNEALSEESTANLFVTLSYLIYDPKEGLLKFSSGGHLPVLLLRKNENVPRLLEAKEGMPLGLMPCDFSEESTPLSKGDILVLYTDGVTEAFNRNKEEFGQDRLTKIVEENKTLNSEGLMCAVKDAVFNFSGTAPQHDDITVIVMVIQ